MSARNVSMGAPAPLNDHSGRPAAVEQRPCKVAEWRPWPFENASLLGHVAIDFSGLVIAQIPVLTRKDGTLSPGVPSVPELDRDGVQLRDANGKKRYSALISFATAESRARWERSVLAALAGAGIGRFGAP